MKIKSIITKIFITLNFISYISHPVWSFHYRRDIQNFSSDERKILRGEILNWINDENVITPLTVVSLLNY